MAVLATLATALLAALSPLIGVRYDSDRDRGARTTSPTVVHPRTLQPVEDAPKLPRDATNVERSPDGDRLAAISDGDLVFASTRSGRYLGRMEIGDIDTGAAEAVLSWIAPDRILLIDRSTNPDRCPTGCWTTRVRVVDPRSRTMVGTPSVFEGDSRTARVAGRQLLLLHEYI